MGVCKQTGSVEDNTNYRGTPSEIMFPLLFSRGPALKKAYMKVAPSLFQWRHTVSLDPANATDRKVAARGGGINHQN